MKLKIYIYSFVPQDKILEILEGDPFLASVKEDGLMNIFSSVKEITRHLTESSSAPDSRVHFAEGRGPELTGAVLRALVRAASVQGGPETPSGLARRLQSALHLVRETSADLASLMRSLLSGPAGDFRSRCPALRDVVLADLTGLRSLVNSSHPLRSRAALDATAGWLAVLSRAGGDPRVREPLLDAAAAAVMLLSDSAGLGGLAASLSSTVRLLGLARTVAGTVATVSEMHFVSPANDSERFFDALYSTLRQSFRNAVHEMTAPKTAARSVLGGADGVLAAFLGLAFGMAGVQPAPRDPDVSHVSSRVFSNVNRSEDFARIVKEVAEFLTSGEINLGDAEHFLGAISNGTRIFSTDSSDIWEEILGCLVPIDNLANQIDFLHPNRISADGFHQDAHGVALEEMLSPNSTEMGTHLRRAMGLISAAFWNNLEDESWEGLDLLLAFAQRPDILSKATDTVVEASGGTEGDRGGDWSEALVFSPSLLQTLAPRGALTGPAPNGPRRVDSTGTPFQRDFEIFGNATAGKNIASGLGEETEAAAGEPPVLGPSPSLGDGLEGLAALAEHWEKVSLTDER